MCTRRLLVTTMSRYRGKPFRRLNHPAEVLEQIGYLHLRNCMDTKALSRRCLPTRSSGCGRNSVLPENRNQLLPANLGLAHGKADKQEAVLSCLVQFFFQR